MKIKALSIAIGMLVFLSSSVSAETTIEPTVLVDQDGIKITATELNCNGRTGDLSLDIENNSDEDVSIISGSMGFDQNAVNGYMPADCYLNVDVSAGKKAKETITIGSKSTAYIDYNDIASIVLSFEVENDDYDTLFISDPVEIKTSAYDTYDFNDNAFGRGIQDKDIVDKLGGKLVDYTEGDLFSLDGVTISKIARVSVNNTEYIHTLLEAENTTDSIVNFRVNGYAVNGITIYQSNWTTISILPHTKSIIDFNPEYMMTRYYGNAVASNIEQETINFVTVDSNYNELNSGDLIVSGETGEYNATIEGAEIYNSDGLQFLIKEVIEDKENELTVVLGFLKNDKDIPIYVMSNDDFSVNDYMIDTDLYTTRVNPHGIGLISIEFETENLKECGIDSIKQLSGYFDIIDENWNDIATVEIDTTL